MLFRSFLYKEGTWMRWLSFRYDLSSDEGLSLIHISTLVMILKILGVGYVNSVKVMMVLFGLVLKIRDYFIFIRKVERLNNSHILLFITMLMVSVWTVMICG